jgi:ferredoxin
MGRHDRDNRVYRLGVNPAACDGVGICMHLAPRLIRADSWGYPLVSDRPLHGADRRTADTAAAACPRRALFVDST